MRKIKITALVLAVLMVMAVFAGCAGKDELKNVSDKLDEHLGEFEKNNEEIKGEIEDIKNDLNEINQELQNANAANAAADEKLNDAIASMLEKLEALNKKLDAVQEETDENTKKDEAQKALEDAQNKALAEIDNMSKSTDAYKGDYDTADFQAIKLALADATTKIQNAKTQAEIDAALNEAKKVFDERATVITRLVNYYKALKNGVSYKQAALIKEVDLYVNGGHTDAGEVVVSVPQTVYGYTLDANGFVVDPIKLPAAITAYENGDINPDNNKPVTVNLIDELKTTVIAYNYFVRTVQPLIDIAIDKIELIGTVRLGTSEALITAAGQACAAVEAEIVETSTYYNKAVNPYAWYLANDNMELIANYERYTAAVKRLEVLRAAVAVYDSALILNIAGSEAYNAFKLYTTNTLYDVVDLQTARELKVDYTLKAGVYDRIDAAIKAWADTYALDKTDITYIVDQKENSKGFYAKYLEDRDTVKKYHKAWADFGAIADKIFAVNKLTTLSTDTFNTFDKVVKEITKWYNDSKMNATNFAKIIEAYKLNNDAKDPAEQNPNLFEVKAFDYTDVTDDAPYEFVAGQQNYIITETNGAVVKTEGPVIEAADYSVEKSYIALFRFVNPKMYTLLGTIYTAAREEADFINARIDAFETLNKTQKADSVFELILIEGKYAPVLDAVANTFKDSTNTLITDSFKKLNADEIAKVLAAATDGQEAGLATTIAQFEAKYHKVVADDDGELGNDSEGYDLTGLVNKDKWQQLYDTVINHIVEQQTKYIEAPTTGLRAQLDAINNTLKTEKVDHIDLSHETAVEKLYNDYITAINVGRLNTLRTFVVETNADTGVAYGKFVLILDEADKLGDAIEAHRVMLTYLQNLAANLIALYENILTYGNFNYKLNGKTPSATVGIQVLGSSKCTEANSKHTFMNKDGVVLKEQANHNAKATTVELLDLAETNYIFFTEANNGKKYTPVQTLNDKFQEHNFMAIKWLVREAFLAFAKNQAADQAVLALEYDYVTSVKDMTTLDNWIRDAVNNWKHDFGAITFGGVARTNAYTYTPGK